MPDTHPSAELRQRGCRRCELPVGTGWRLVAEADPTTSDRPADAALTALEIRGVDAGSLWSVRVRAHGELLFALDSIADGRGGWIAAGELVRDMAAQCGLQAMAIDLDAAGADGSGLGVELVVVAEADPCAHVRLIAHARPAASSP